MMLLRATVRPSSFENLPYSFITGRNLQHPETSSCYSLTADFSCQQQPFFPQQPFLSSFFTSIFFPLFSLSSKIPSFLGKGCLGFPCLCITISPTNNTKTNPLAIAVPWPFLTLAFLSDWLSALPTSLQFLENYLNISKLTFNQCTLLCLEQFIIFL